MVTRVKNSMDIVAHFVLATFFAIGVATMPISGNRVNLYFAALSGFALAGWFSSFVYSRAVTRQWKVGQDACDGLFRELHEVRQTFLTEKIVNARLRELALEANIAYEAQRLVGFGNENASKMAALEALKTMERFWEAQNYVRLYLKFPVKDNVLDYLK